MIDKWDRDYLDLIEWWASRKSKDPSTQVGAAIVRPDRTLASLGYNGLPRGVQDTHERLFHRPLKYLMTVHAEPNAVAASREPLHGYTCYTWPLPPCGQCAALLIQCGIKRVVSPNLPPLRAADWVDSVEAGREMFKEAGVEWEVSP